MRYGRDAAIAYARKYWDRPCDDGVFWCRDHVVSVDEMRKFWKASAKDGWEPRFVPDGAEREQAVFLRSVGETLDTIVFQKWNGLADCAHFLSRCMHAGGLSISEVAVPKLIRNLKRRSDVTILAEQLTRAQGQRIVDSGVLKNGDIVGYFNVDPNGDWGGIRQYTHSTMYAGKLKSGDAGRITCHTMSRFPGLSACSDLWHLDNDSHTYSFFHFTHDDIRSLHGASDVTGWWNKIDDATGYYYLDTHGRSYLSMHPPRRHHDPPSASLQTGHWFLRGGEVTFIWSQRGDVDVWRQLGPDQFSTTLNGIGRTAVRRMSPDAHR